jgi:hypothetical protein
LTVFSGRVNRVMVAEPKKEEPTPAADGAAKAREKKE